MAKLQYNLSVKTELDQDLGTFQDVVFGRETKELDLQKAAQDNIRLYEHGLVNQYLIHDNHLSLPGLRGLVSLANIMLQDGDEQRLGTQIFTEASGLQIENILSIVLKRQADRVTIEKILSKLKPKNGAILLEEYDHIPTYNTFLDSKKTYTDLELFNLSHDFDAFVVDNSIDTNAFFDGMEWQSWQDLNFNKFNITDIGFINIETKYFPIHPEVTVLVFIDGDYEQARIQGLDPYNGIVRIDLSEHVNGSNIAEFEGIRLFYGITPAVILNNKEVTADTIARVPEDNLLTQEPKITIEASTSSHIDPVYVDKNQLYIKTASWDNLDTDNLKIYNTKDSYNIFLEPSSYIIANDQLLAPGTKNYLKINELEYKELLFKPASATFKLKYILEPVTFSNETNTIFMDQDMASEVAAIFGKFGDRYVLLAWSWPEADVVRGYSSLGFSQGPYSGAAGQKEFGTNILYVGQQQDPGSYYTNIMFDINTVYVKPKRGDSLEVELPTWAVPGTIQVKEVTAQASQTAFTHFEYVEPDIVILDKNKVNYNKTYVIIYKQFNLPFIDEIDISTGGIKTIISQDYRFLFQKDLTNPYENFDGLYLLSNKNIYIDIGYVNKSDLTKYYINNARIKISQLVDKKFLDHFTSNKVY